MEGADPERGRHGYYPGVMAGQDGAAAPDEPERPKRRRRRRRRGARPKDPASGSRAKQTASGGRQARTGSKASKGEDRRRQPAAKA